MTIINTNASQTLKSIATILVSDSLSIVVENETTKQIYTVSVNSYSYSSDILFLNVTLNFLLNNTFYNYKLIMNSNVIYKDRIFCTNQNIDTFSINNGQYITPTINNNSYITI